MSTSRTRGTLGEVIDRMQESERRLDAPAPELAADDIIRALLVAIENHQRAVSRQHVAQLGCPPEEWLSSAGNLTGAQVRLDAAMTAAQQHLNPTLRALC